MARLTPPRSVDLAGQQADHAKIADCFCARAVKYLRRHPPRDEHDLRKMQARLLPRIHNEVCGFIGFAIVVSEFVAWALQKLFDWLLSKWWLKDHNAKATCGMIDAVLQADYRDEYTSTPAEV